LDPEMSLNAKVGIMCMLFWIRGDGKTRYTLNMLF
jgi:hypothetical protein